MCPTLSLGAAAALVHRCVVSAVLIFICLCTMALPNGAAAVVAPLGDTAQSVHLCYLYFGAITDFGWTYSYNSGRLTVHEELSRRYPNASFRSTYTENVFYMTREAKHATIAGYVAGGCDVILSNSATLMNDEDDVFAAAFPNVSFVLLDEYRMEDVTYPNRVYIAGDFTGGYYAAGAAAGMQAATCIGFLAAWSTELDPTNAWAGFLLGVRSVNRTIPVHVVPQGSWYDPTGDDVLVAAMVDTLGCQVIGRYSDPFTADVAVSTRRRHDVFTVGAHSDLELFVGDSVLVSVYMEWSVMLMKVLLPLLDHGALNQSKVHFYGMADGVVVVADVSPRARSTVAAAMDAAVQHVQQHRDRVVCGVLPLRNGGYVLLNTTPNTTCKVPHHNINDFITDSNVVHHQPFVAPNTCDAGTAFVYDATGSRSLRCVPCPRGFYSSLPGSARCIACPAGTTSDSAAATCISAAENVPPAAIVGIALGGFVAALMLAALYVKLKAVYDANVAAPRLPPLCLVYVDIEACGPIAKLCGHDMHVARKLFLGLVRSIVQRNGVYEACDGVKDGEVVVLACATAVDAIGVAVELQETMALATWPPTIRDLGGLKPRIAVQLCTEVCVSFHASLWRYVYHGMDVDAGRALVRLAPSGAILADQRTMDAATAEDDFALVLTYEVAVRLWRAAAQGPLADLLWSDDPNDRSEVTLRHRLDSSNIYCLDSKQLQQTHHAAGGVLRIFPGRGATNQSKQPRETPSTAPLEGADPDLERSAHSSFSTNSSLTLGRQAIDMGPPQVALALYGLFLAVESISPVRKKRLLASLMEIFALDGAASSRRVAASLAFRILHPTNIIAPSGPTTTGSASPGLVEDPRAHVDHAMDDAMVMPPVTVTPTLCALPAVSTGRRVNPLSVPPPTAAQRAAGASLTDESNASWAVCVPANQHQHMRSNIVLPGGVVFHPDESGSTAVSQPTREIEMLRPVASPRHQS